MTIELSCNRCFAKHRFKDKAAGKEIACKQCGTALQVPGVIVARGPRALVISDSVRRSLLQLRLYEERQAEQMTPPRQLPAPALSLDLLKDVEAELKCTLPDDILAAMACGVMDLEEREFDLGQVVGNTKDASERGCPKGHVAVGRDPDGLAYFCVESKQRPNAESTLVDFDLLDLSMTVKPFAVWLEDLVDIRREDLVKAEITVTDELLAGFRPALVETLP